MECLVDVKKECEKLLDEYDIICLKKRIKDLEEINKRGVR